MHPDQFIQEKVNELFSREDSQTYIITQALVKELLASAIHYGEQRMVEKMKGHVEEIESSYHFDGTISRSEVLALLTSNLTKGK